MELEGSRSLFWFANQKHPCSLVLALRYYKMRTFTYSWKQIFYFLTTLALPGILCMERPLHHPVIGLTMAKMELKIPAAKHVKTMEKPIEKPTKKPIEKIISTWKLIDRTRLTPAISSSCKALNRKYSETIYQMLLSLEREDISNLSNS